MALLHAMDYHALTASCCGMMDAWSPCDLGHVSRRWRAVEPRFR